MNTLILSLQESNSDGGRGQTSTQSMKQQNSAQAFLILVAAGGARRVPAGSGGGETLQGRRPRHRGESRKVCLRGNHEQGRGTHSQRSRADASGHRVGGSAGKQSPTTTEDGVFTAKVRTSPCQPSLHPLSPACFGLAKFKFSANSKEPSTCLFLPSDPKTILCSRGPT